MILSQCVQFDFRHQQSLTMGNINDHLGNIEINDPGFNWEWGPSVEDIVLTVKQKIGEQFRCDESTRFLHQFVHDENCTHWSLWVSKTWNTIDFRKCLSNILKRDTTSWDPHQLCDEVNVLCPRHVVRPDRHTTDLYWIRKKDDHEL